MDEQMKLAYPTIGKLNLGSGRKELPLFKRTVVYRPAASF
jgi:hypothetical protein